MLSERIKERRKAARMTQQALGDAVGVAKTTVCGWEKGKFRPDIEMLERISSVLGTTSVYLMGYSDQPESTAKAYYSRASVELPPMIKLPGQFEVKPDSDSDSDSDAYSMSFGNSYSRTLSDTFLENEKPSTSLEAKGKEVSTDEMRKLLCNLGYIRQNDTLSKNDWDFLDNLFGMLDAWFERKGL